jgi:hypothetical protein
MHYFDMKTGHFFAVLSIACLALLSACSKTTATDSAVPVVTVAPSAANQANAALQAPTQTVSKLGDLTMFRLISTEVAALVDKGDIDAAKLRVKDLELAWDSAEAGLKPRAAADWHILDKKIDPVLTALRAETPSLADCKQVTAELLKTFDKFQEKY